MRPAAMDDPPGRVHEAPRREKRCSCENQKDKECIFFCHIGIVWVNTPRSVPPSPCPPCPPVPDGQMGQVQFS